MSPKQEASLKNSIKLFYARYKTKWEDSHRTRTVFLQNNAAWLQQEFVLPDIFKTTNKRSAGRPKVEFQESSSRTKQRRTKFIREDVPKEELIYAASSSLRSSGEVTTAKILQEATTTTPTRASKIWNAYKDRSKMPSKFTADEALSLFVESKYTRHQYLLLRSATCAKNANIFPSYQQLQKAKNLCYPQENYINVTEAGAEINLQGLLDHTAERIGILQEDVFKHLSTESLQNIQLISKWGCDGSSGQSLYKQRFMDSNLTDSDLFLTSLVPIRLTTSDNSCIIWQNPRPSSPRYCRPIRFFCRKESREFVQEEVNIIRKQIEELRPTDLCISGVNIKIIHVLNFTMIDGKLCNTITSSSSQVCYICKAAPKEMNNIDLVKNREVELHTSYRIEIKAWQIRGEENKRKMEIRKKEIQKKIRERMGLLVDVPKAGGSGTTNDGNTARRFFNNPSLSSEITGIDQEVISKFSIILQAISSGFAINTEYFDAFALETARLFISLYPWFYMPPSVHKILIHGHQIISHALISIGHLSEEAQEARFKDIKRYRAHHSRKHSRMATNRDVLNTLLISSDPLISSLRKLPVKSTKSLSKEVLSLLLPPDISPPQDKSFTETDTETDTETETEMETSSSEEDY